MSHSLLVSLEKTPEMFKALSNLIRYIRSNRPPMNSEELSEVLISEYGITIEPDSVLPFEHTVYFENEQHRLATLLKWL